MDILPSTLRDLGPLRHVEQTCFPKDAWPLLDLIAVLTWPNVVRLKAVEDGKMIGFIAADIRQADQLAWIATIGVLPEYQRKGVGRLLLRTCEGQLEVPRVRLCVRASNIGAIEMYRAEGYLPFDTWKKYYDDGENALVMEKYK